MDAALGIAGVICVAMAFGHASIGLIWVLPGLSDEHLPRTPFGPRSMTASMVRVTWHVVTVFVLGLGGILLSLAWVPDPDPKTLLLRWFAAMWIAATAVAAWVVLRRVGSIRGLVRLPVPLLWVVVAWLCWQAST